MITVGAGVYEVLAILAPFVVLGVAVTVVVAMFVLVKKRGFIFKASLGVVGALALVGAFASNMALDGTNKFESFDNPVAAQASVDESVISVASVEIPIKEAEIHEGSLKKAIVETAGLDKITEMRSGDGFYKTLANGEELKFTAERNHSEVDGKVSFEEVEGTVSYTEDSIVVTIVDGVGNQQVFKSSV